MLPEGEREGELERSFLETRGSVATWLASIDAVPDFPTMHRGWAVRFLAEEARGPRRPFTTLVVIEVVRLVPGLAGPGLLRELAGGPGSQTVRFAALEALAAGPRPEDVPFLRGLLDVPDTREARRALRALAGSDRGAPLLVSWLREHRDDMPEGLTRDLALSFQKTGGLQDARLVGDLLRSQQPAVVQAVLRSLRNAAGVEDEPLPDDLVAPVVALTTADDSKVRRDAIAALASLGDSGLGELRSIAQDRSRPPRERIQAAGSLLDLAPEAAAALSPGLVRTASNAQEAYRAAQLGAASPSALSGVVAELRRWMTAHPGEAARLVDLIEYGNDGALIERAEELRGAMTGGTR